MLNCEILYRLFYIVCNNLMNFIHVMENDVTV